MSTIVFPPLQPPPIIPAWLIYGSEVAAAIGKNPYKKRWEVLLNVWKRLNHGQSYKEAVQRLQEKGITVDTKESKLQKVIEHTQIQPLVQSLLNETPRTSQEVQHLLETFHTQVVPIEQAQQQQIHALEARIVQEKHEEMALEQKVQQLQQLQQVQQVPSSTSQLDIQEQIKMETNHLDVLHQIIQSQEHHLAQHKQVWHDFKEAKKEVCSQLKTTYGTVQEEHNINTQEFGTILQNNQAFHKKSLGQISLTDKAGQITKTYWGVGGRIDGFRDNVLIEIKNRVTKLFTSLPEYDVIQIQTYMHLLDQPKAILIQRLVTNTSHISVKETLIERDYTQWNEIILPGLKQFIKALGSLYTNLELQEEILKIPDQKKYQKMNSLFSKKK